MSAKIALITQKLQRSRINEAAQSLHSIAQPKHGWIKEVREALGMSGAQLAVRLGVGRARVSRLEKAETEGSITLRSLNDAAEAMGCKLVYAIVPQESVEGLIEQQARQRATEIVEAASTHMSLEKQALSQQQIEERITRMTKEFLEAPTKELWSE